MADKTKHWQQSAKCKTSKKSDILRRQVVAVVLYGSMEDLLTALRSIDPSGPWKDKTPGSYGVRKLKTAR